MSTNKTNKTNKTATKANVKVVNMGKTMSQADVEDILARLAAAEAEKARLESEKAELQARIKTSANRSVKAPDSYDVLQPLFVAARSSVNKGIVDNQVLIDILNNTAKALKISITETLSEKLVNKTILFNSLSNMAKATDQNGIASRINAFQAMLQQAKVLLPLLSDSFYKSCIAQVENKAKAQRESLKK